MERHDLVRRTKQLLGDVQENKAYGVAEKNQNKVQAKEREERYNRYNKRQDRQG